MIYLDYASTTPVDERVAEKMAEFLTVKEKNFGNPHSKHEFGKRAHDAVEEARNHVASLINAKPECILWTSGATESNNLAIKGAAQFYSRKGRHIITSQTEHRSVLEVCNYLMQSGYEVTFLKPNPSGIVELDSLKAALREDTILVSLMHVNNETGNIQSIEKMAELTRSHGIILHVDAVQSIGKLPIDVKNTAIDLMSCSAHKLYGPKGIGALYITDDPKARLTPLLHGSGQERNLRSGTLATHQIVGMGEAYRIAKEEGYDMEKYKHLSNIFWDGIKTLPGAHLNGHLTQRLPSILNICFEHKEKESWIKGLESLAFSSSSACSASTLETSHVLRAMGLHNEWAHRSLRFSFGRESSEDEVYTAIELINRHYGN